MPTRAASVPVTSTYWPVAVTAAGKAGSLHIGESKLTIVIMDSGLALGAPRNDGRQQSSANRARGFGPGWCGRCGRQFRPRCQHAQLMRKFEPAPVPGHSRRPALEPAPPISANPPLHRSAIPPRSRLCRPPSRSRRRRRWKGKSSSQVCSPQGVPAQPKSPLLHCNSSSLHCNNAVPHIINA
jgi:hypothetical protein